jgi:integrase
MANSLSPLLTRWEIGREFGKSADLGRTAAEFARHSRAPATESAYASDWADFSAWCNSEERLALPAEPVTIGAYLSDRSGILKVPTLNRRLAAITAMHRFGGHGLDGKHPAIALVLAGIRRTYGTRQVAKRALLTEDLRRIVRKLRVDRPGGCRDRAVLLVGFGAALRRSELIALDLDDITITQAGLTILVRRSKTDQEGQGREIGIPRSRKSATCPVAALEAWLALDRKNENGLDEDFSGDRIGNGNPNGVLHAARRRGKTPPQTLARGAGRRGRCAKGEDRGHQGRGDTARPEEGRGTILEARVDPARAIQPHRQGPAAGGAGHLRERICVAVHQPDADRLGDAVHTSEGSADGRAGARRAATGEARGVNQRAPLLKTARN